MQRFVLVTGTALGLLVIPAPSDAFFHNAVHNPVLHTVLDVLTGLVVTAPLWTVHLWARRRRGLLLALVAIVQLPVAVIGFVPIIDPLVHVTLGVTALALTAGSLVWVRRATRTDAPALVAPEAGWHRA
jgi:hypothetical protein